MASTYSAAFRLNYQAPGDNLNVWGTVLNTGVFQLLEDAIAGRVAFSLTGTKTLTTANGSTDEARKMFLDITGGSGGTITIPSVAKVYLVRNGSTGSAIISTGAGVEATIVSGVVTFVVCDGTNVRHVRPTDFGGQRVTNVGTPTSDADAATKLYVDLTAFAMTGGTFPGQSGNADNVLFTNGTTPFWGPALPAPSRKTTSFAAVDKGRYPVDTAAGVVVMTLPASPAEGDYVQAWDAGVTLSFNGFATNKLTIARNGSTINGIADDVECNTRGAALSFEFVNGTWSIRNGC